MEDARAKVASLVGASPKEIVFTSGATESNNISIKGAARFYGMKGAKHRKHVVTTQTEHKCVLDSCRFLEQEGFEVTYLPVQAATGMVDVAELEASLREDTLLVSVMAVNNEIGTRQPVEEIGQLCRKKKILFHTDGEWFECRYTIGFLGFARILRKNLRKVQLHIDILVHLVIGRHLLACWWWSTEVASLGSVPVRPLCEHAQRRRG